MADEPVEEIKEPLKPCPFCGVLPAVTSINNLTIVLCLTPFCAINPTISGHWSDVLKGWNRRRKELKADG